MKTKIGILGYGNLGRGVELALLNAKDMELVGVFSRRNPESVKTVYAKAYSVDQLCDFKDKIDVLILCGGSHTDLPVQSIKYIKDFNTVDSFDTHAKVPEYYSALNTAGKESGKLGAMSIGWDPGLFSLTRLLFGSILPNGKDYTFWGKGVSQGHSDAIRRIDGVVDAVQFTVPNESALDKVRASENPTFTTREKHTRECFVAVSENADKEFIKNQIVNMPNYFADYDTTVNFVSKEEVNSLRGKLAHGGYVLRTGETSNGTNDVLELSIKLDSNPEFTGSVLVAYARAVARLSREGVTGAITVFDIAPKYFSAIPDDEQRKNLL